MLVQVASQYESSVYIEAEGKKVNAKSIMGMMSLALGTGESVKVIANGNDEQAAIDSIEEYAHSKATITARIAALENRASEGDESDTEDYTKSVCATAEELLDRTLTEEEKNRILRSIISEIVFDRAAMTIRAVYFSPF